MAYKWTEAFEKYGFDDGEFADNTLEVVEVLKDMGYEVHLIIGGHNTYIRNLIKVVDGEDITVELSKEDRMKLDKYPWDFEDDCTSYAYCEDCGRPLLSCTCHGNDAVDRLKEWLDAKDIAEANLERQREKRGEEE